MLIRAHVARIHTRSLTWGKCNLESLHKGRKLHTHSRHHSSSVSSMDQEGFKGVRVKGVLCHWTKRLRGGGICFSSYDGLTEI